MDDQTADLNVNVNRTGGGMSRMQWVSVVGVGTVLLVVIVPRMMTLIGKVIPANTEALIGVKSELEDTQEDREETRRVLRSNTKALNKLRDVIGPDDEEESE